MDSAGHPTPMSSSHSGSGDGDGGYRHSFPQLPTGGLLIDGGTSFPPPLPPPPHHSDSGGRHRGESGGFGSASASADEAMHDGAGASGSKAYACPTCGKTFSRRDYLDRHVLNHQKPSEVCAQCGKAFARADVLRKHLATSCPGAKKDGSPHDDDSISAPPGGNAGRGGGASVGTGGGTGGKISRRDSKRRKSSPNGSYISSRTAHTTHTMHTARMSTDWTTGLADGLGAVHEGVIDEPLMGGGPASTTRSGMFPGMVLPVGAGVGAASMQATSIGQPEAMLPQSTVNPDLIGENMGDLLQWLFQPPPEVASSTYDFTGPSTSADGSAGAFVAEPDPMGLGVLPPVHPTDPSSQSPHAGNTAPLPISFVVPFPPVQVVNSKEPQAIHPYTHPNKWKPGLFPPFIETGPRRTMPRPRETLDEAMRREILRLFDMESAALSLERMRFFLDMFFVHFAPLYPIIHRASLPYRLIAPDLLLAMICIGTAYASDHIALDIACRVARILRHRLFLLIEEEPRAPVSVLQTALLVNHFSRSFGDVRQHEAAQIFHPPIIITSRLSGVFLPKFTPPATDGSVDPLAYWLEWVEEEERKRVGYFAFMMDTESVALFKNPLQMQCVSLQTEMPLGSAPWLALDPYEWNGCLRTYPLPLSFRTSLRHIISLGFIPPNLDEVHLWLVLHGMLSASWSLLWRDLGDLSMMHDQQITQWKTSMRTAFDTWRTYVAATQMPVVKRIGIPFCLFGCIVLLTDTEQVRIFAGATSIGGRPIAPGEWTAANAYVNSWARSQDGAYACHYAAMYEVYKSDWTFSPSIIPWCAYIASLVIWTYATVLDGPEPLREPFISVAFSHAPTPTHPPQVRIEPTGAGAAAEGYLSAILACPHPFSLPDLPGKARCGGVIAYTAHLVGGLQRGMTRECWRVLVGLLRDEQGGGGVGSGGV